jgi:hypothetical protein
MPLSFPAAHGKDPPTQIKASLLLLTSLCDTQLMSMDDKKRGSEGPADATGSSKRHQGTQSGGASRGNVRTLGHIKGHQAVIATCDSSKERNAVKELQTLLEEAADELYPRESSTGECKQLRQVCPFLSLVVRLIRNRVSLHGCRPDGLSSRR